MNEFERILKKKEGGRKGGSSTSPAKRAAARRNGLESRKEGKKGGRPVGTKTRTLGEFLLRRKLTKAEHELASKAIFRLSTGLGVRSEKSQFMKFFRIERDSYLYLGDVIETRDYTAKHAKPGTTIHLILKQFRVAARHFLNKK